MKNGLTEIIIFHDNNAPVPNFDEQIRKCSKTFFSTLKKAEADGEIRITLGAFGEGYKLYANDTPVAAVRLTIKNLTQGNGVRNIFDSLGNAIIEKGQAYSASDENEHPENIIFIITAFGRDNASKSFAYSQLTDMIAHQSYVYKWTFLCLTSEPLLTEQLGILPENIIRLDTEEEDFFDKALDDLAARIIAIINK